MADEITISLNVDVAAGNYRASFRPGTIQPDMAGFLGSDISQNITTTIMNLNVGAVGTTAAGTSFPFLNLRPGEIALGRCVTTSFSAIAATATADLQFGILSL